MLDLDRAMRRADREREARKQAESLLEQKSRDLYLANHALQKSHETLEQRVAERIAELAAINVELEKANRTKSEFLANMSHEIRTPLNGILGFTDILHKNDRDLSDEERADYLQTIRSSSRHLLTLIDGILDLSKIEAGMLEIQRISCSPHQIISEIVSVLRVRAREKGLTLEYHWSGRIPATIQTDPILVRQLVMNLIGNAIKFTEIGSVQIVAKLTSSDIRPQLAIEVTDTGIGISAGNLERIFDQFVQADTSVTRRFGGTGLGLAISRRLARSLGGDIQVQSELGRGSVFLATIDPGSLGGVSILESSATSNEVSDLTERSNDLVVLPAAHILLVEDGETNRKLISLILRRAGATVTTAENGQIGVEVASAGQFDLILMDMQMPVMDGYTATRLLRSRGYSSPIIALTAHAMKGDVGPCRAAGCSGYLTKPIDSDVLLRAVADVLRSAEERAWGYSPDSSALSTVEPPVMSTLPTDDPEFHEIVMDFVKILGEKVSALQVAWSDRNFPEMIRLAHWLKGAAGTVGFPAFTAPAAELEQLARNKETELIEAALKRIVRLADRVVV